MRELLNEGAAAWRCGRLGMSSVASRCRQSAVPLGSEATAASFRICNAIRVATPHQTKNHKRCGRG